MTTLLVPPSSPDLLPAGGSDPDRFDWQMAWYPVFYVDDLDRTKLTPFTLLGQNLVIWWDQAASTWRAFVDQCPHRLAPLSEGRLNEQGLLECPYHGWAFSGEGNCEVIPQQRAEGQAHTSQRACAKALATCLHQGLLFIFAGNPELAAKTAVPTVDVLDDDSGEWVCLNTFRDIPYDALTLLENVLDSSHIPYTHHRTVGNRANVGPVELEVVQADRQGFKGVWEEGPRRGTLGRQETTFIAPNLMWHDLTSKQFGRTLTVVYATPIRKGYCRLFARFPFKFPSQFPRLAIQLTPRWYSHLGQSRVLEDDQIFLHWQERYLEARGGSEQFTQACYLPTKADRFVAQLRQWVNHYQAESFPDQFLSPALSTELLLDRYHSHTQHCASCRQALKTIQRVRQVAVIIAVIILSLLPLLVLSGLQTLSLGLGLSLLLALAVVLWFGLGQLAKSFYQGNPIPPRNQPEKKRR